MSERVEPTKYKLTVEFATSQQPEIGGITPELIAAIRGVIGEIGVTEGTVDQVYLVHTPRWRQTS